MTRRCIDTTGARLESRVQNCPKGRGAGTSRSRPLGWSSVRFSPASAGSERAGRAGGAGRRLEATLRGDVGPGVRTLARGVVGEDAVRRRTGVVGDRDLGVL